MVKGSYFLDREIEASLKLIGRIKVSGLEQYFLDREIEASLKPRRRIQGQMVPPNFLDREIEASLKPWGSPPGTPATHQFPRSRDRGLIEASVPPGDFLASC